MKVRVLQGTAPGPRPTPRQDAYDQFRLERQGNRLSPRTLASYDYHVERLFDWLRAEQQASTRCPTAFRVESAFGSMRTPAVTPSPPRRARCGGTSSAYARRWGHADYNDVRRTSSPLDGLGEGHDHPRAKDGHQQAHSVAAAQEDAARPLRDVVERQRAQAHGRVGHG